MISIEKQKEYMQAVSDLVKPELKDNRETLGNYLFLKLISELGELVGEICKDVYHNKELNPQDIKLECGDITWYLYNCINMVCLSESSRGKIFQDICNETANIYTSLNDESIISDCREIIKDAVELEEICYDGSATTHLIIRSIGQFMARYLVRVGTRYGFTYEDILDANLEKLYNRFGGQQYNAQHYTEPANGV